MSASLADWKARGRSLLAVVLWLGVLAPARATAAQAANSAEAQTAQSTGAQTAQPAEPPATERSARFDLIDNGDFAEHNDTVVDARGVRPIPWWRSARGSEQIVASAQAFALRTAGDEWAEQPVAAYAPLIDKLAIRGRVAGSGRLTVIDGSGGRASFELGNASTTPVAFSIDCAQIEARLGRKPLPRLCVRLEPASAQAAATWSDIAVEVELPCPTEKELHAEILALLRTIIEPWLERGLDNEGPRKTSFVCHEFDAVTGERLLSSGGGGFNPLYEQLARALEVEDVPQWRAAFERYLEDFLTLGLQPETGLPRIWNTDTDEPIVDRPAGDLGLQLAFLIDMATRGPERFRERARAASIKIGETVLAKGRMPDGNVGASYFPLDARVNTGVNSLRRFDVPAQLGRLSALTGDARYLHAASEALATFEFTHYWAGTWAAIDPGFDDEFGNYAARAATIALAQPKDVFFKRFALEGFEHFAPIWNDALRLGGNVAADQVRCWNLLIDLAQVEPATKERIHELLRRAARSHFKGEQYGEGAWGDVTIFGFDPVRNIQVGDYTGAPQNLLHGLAAIYSGDVGLRTDEVRALYTTVLRSSVATYQRKYGFLLERTARNGQNRAAGTLRMLLGLVKMLARV